MRRLISNPLVVAVVLTSLSAAACSKGSSTGSPLAPSTSTAAPATSSPAPLPAPAPVTGGATISGVVVTGSPALALLRATGVSRVTVTVVGTTVITSTDDNGNFTLQNVPAGSQTLSINGNGIAAQVALAGVSLNEQIRVTVRVEGGGATLDDRQRETADSQVEVEGQITSAGGGTIVVGRLNTAVVVPSTAAITRGGATAKVTDLIPGVRVEVHGVKAGTTVTATRVNIETEVSNSSGGTSTTPTGSSDATETELTGTLAAKPAGACPAITFQVASTTVTTNASTRFDDAVCSSLAAGDTVKVEGAKQSNGSVLAKEVKRTASAPGSTGSSSGDDKSNDNKSGSGSSDDKGGSSGNSSGSGDDKGGNSGSGKGK